MKTEVKLFTAPKTAAQHQINVIRWSMTVRDKYPELALLFHIPNGGSRDLREAAHMKEQGVKPGVPDLCLPVARGSYHGLYVEMKAPRGKESDVQKWWGTQLRIQGYFVALARGWEQAVQIIEMYLNLVEGGSEHGVGSESEE